MDKRALVKVNRRIWYMIDGVKFSVTWCTQQQYYKIMRCIKGLIV